MATKQKKKRQPLPQTLEMRVKPHYRGQWLNRKRYEAAIRAGRIPLGLVNWDKLEPLIPSAPQHDVCDCCDAPLTCGSMGTGYTLSCACDHPYSVCNVCLRCPAHHSEADHELANAAGSLFPQVERVQIIL